MACFRAVTETVPVIPMALLCEVAAMDMLSASVDTLQTGGLAVRWERLRPLIRWLQACLAKTPLDPSRSDQCDEG